MRFKTLLLILSLTGLSACQIMPGQDPEPPSTTPTPTLPTTTETLPASFDLSLCNSTSGTLPANDGSKIIRQSALACTQDVQYLIAPVPNACLLSGFGPRSNRSHEGIDYQGKGRTAVPIVAAAKGTVVINKWRKDLGHWIVLDHGNGIYTGYGHLKNASDKQVGTEVNMNEPLGMMGATGSASRGLHLHVEFRKGVLRQAAHGGYFNLKSFDPYESSEGC